MGTCLGACVLLHYHIICILSLEHLLCSYKVAVRLTKVSKHWPQLLSSSYRQALNSSLVFLSNGNCFIHCSKYSSARCSKLPDILTLWKYKITLQQNHENCYKGMFGLIVAVGNQLQFYNLLLVTFGKHQTFVRYIWKASNNY